MNYSETIEYLYSYLPMFQRVGTVALKKDLNNTVYLANFLENPQNNLVSVHIAGTNGKGSTAHTLAAILQSAGYKTGLYTSPHLKHFTERIKVNGKEMEEEAVVAFVEKIKPAIDAIHPSFFEVTVAMAFDYFAREEVDIAVIETGLGGRLDSTNIISPVLSLITNIGFDHQALLGNTLVEIAREKAGIIKPEVPVVIGEYQEEVVDVFKDIATRLKAPLFFAEKEVSVQQSDAHKDQKIVNITYQQKPYIDDLKLALSGSYQLRNIPGIIKAVFLLQNAGFTIEQKDIERGFMFVNTLTGFKGRWQTLQQKPLVICDTGHNESGMTYIVQQLNALAYQNLHFVLGMANDKALDGIFSILPKDAFYYFCQAKIPRALEAAILAERAATFGLKGIVVRDVNEAIDRAKAHAEVNDVIFIGGSSFVVAEIEQL